MLRRPFTAARRSMLVAIGVASVVTTTMLAQTPGGDGRPKTGPAFDVASIRLNETEDTSGSVRTLPDGTYVLVNSGLSNLITAAYRAPLDVLVVDRMERPTEN